MLGVAQWFCILARPIFSAFDNVYPFVRREPGDRVVHVLLAGVGEFLLFLALLPLAGAALDRPWAPLAVATDAAPNFGFGVSVAGITSELAASLGRTYALIVPLEC